MVRRETCGKAGNRSVNVPNPVDGTWRINWYCSAHRELREQVIAEQRALTQAGGIPEPLPNRGGLLPCYLRWNWPDLYAAASPGWKPPAVGIRADDWPTLAKVAVLAPPEFTLVVGGETAEPAPFPADTPALRLIKGDG
jgi:hypothetical protein